jgi:carboxyl-terminal processing protease
MQAQIKQEKENDLIRFKDQIKELLEEEIVLQSYYQWGRLEKSLKNDPEVMKAEEIFANGNLYVQTLGNRN